MLQAFRAFAVSHLAGAGAASLFAGRALVAAFRPPFELKETARQIYEIGWRSLPLITASGFAVGIVLSMQTRASLERFGAEALIPTGLALALVRETGPLVTGLLLAGRVGAGVGAELGAMKVTEQIDALEAVAVDSFKFLVVTRMIACMVAMPLLTAVMNFTGIVGGWVAEAPISGMDFTVYFRTAFSAVQFTDYIPSTLKTVVFGFIIAITAAYLGVNARGGTQGVGYAATRAVVVASILMIAANVVLVRLIFFIFPEAAG
ncbi:MAG: ABC transporter permease [Acidobacteria bacterium]|nr:ABC transporter permease [Acidobacteriota bacterium]MYJ04779.1 ABC transporter permease [Acidobacteriota bacterium]